MSSPYVSRHVLKHPSTLSFLSKPYSVANEISLRPPTLPSLHPHRHLACCVGRFQQPGTGGQLAASVIPRKPSPGFELRCTVHRPPREPRGGAAQRVEG